MKPLAIELFAGLFGWGVGLVAEGWRSIGFDIVQMGPVPEGCSLVLQDVTTLSGAQFKDAALIVASPPCQAYSYRAMPWKRAKALPPPDNTLFDACFRIQREASEAAGRYIPMVVENVCGAQKWVGPARWHYGSYYLWGDVPALMPMTKQVKVPNRAYQRDGFSHTRKLTAPFEHNRLSRVGFNVAAARMYREGIKHGGDCFNDPSWPGKQGGVKQHGSGSEWFDTGIAKHSSRSDSRKAASAQIAKIPFPLARWIARCFKPLEKAS